MERNSASPTHAKRCVGTRNCLSLASEFGRTSQSVGSLAKTVRDQAGQPALTSGPLLDPVSAFAATIGSLGSSDGDSRPLGHRLAQAISQVRRLAQLAAARSTGRNEREQREAKGDQADVAGGWHEAPAERRELGRMAGSCKSPTIEAQERS